MFARFNNRLLSKVNQLKLNKKKFSSNPSNPTNLMELKTRLNYALGFFSVGGIVEMYTYSHEKDFSRSVGLGWGILGMILILS
jgi:hypothetical protein